jgi:UDP-N-acetylglucosamine 2-epimerase (non-hydrolysing)
LNRIEVDSLAQKLFCTEESAMRHLDQEKAPGDAYLVGNTMIDTLLRMLPRLDEAVLPQGLPAAYAVATIHRPSNVDDADALKPVLSFIAEVSARCPVVLPMHHRLKASLEKFNFEEILPPTVVLLEPQPYLPFLRLMRGAQFLLTDSGGIQEEAVLLRKRCFTLRRNTERPVTIAVGSNLLVDPALARDRAVVLEFAAAPGDVGVDIPMFWDGHAGTRIVDILRGV